nr:hypothetical protein [Modestobacter roseus]
MGTCTNSIRSLRPRGRHVQVGLLPPATGRPEIPMELVIARELAVLGSHGMAAGDYPAMLSLISAGRLRPTCWSPASSASTTPVPRWPRSAARRGSPSSARAGHDVLVTSPLSRLPGHDDGYPGTDIELRRAPCWRSSHCCWSPGWW